MHLIILQRSTDYSKSELPFSVIFAAGLKTEILRENMNFYSSANSAPQSSQFKYSANSQAYHLLYRQNIKFKKP